MTTTFEGKIALVTGGGSGIGRATSLEFARRGAKVVVVGRTKANIEETMELIRNFHGEAIALQSDVSVEAQVESMIEQTLKIFGRLDFACNAAGVAGKLGYTVDCTEDDFNSIVDVNLKGVWLCMKHQIKQMETQRSGVIVNISSIDGLHGVPGAPIYSASKHGVIGLTKTAALEYVKSNIRINAICPGAIQTPMLNQAIAEAGMSRQAIEAEIPMGRIGSPDDIAQSVTWLCSDNATFITGHIMVIDGGEMA